jgi:hypothetical protein
MHGKYDVKSDIILFLFLLHITYRWDISVMAEISESPTTTCDEKTGAKQLKCCTVFKYSTKYIQAACRQFQVSVIIRFPPAFIQHVQLVQLAYTGSIHR